MADTTSASADAIKSRRRETDQQARKKPKTALPTFSDPKSSVTFLVGPDPDPVEFLIHKEVACQYSNVLVAALKSNFIKGQTQTYRLEDTAERAFKLFMQWMYSQKLTLMQTASGYKSQYHLYDTEDSEDESLVELWILADKLLVRPLQNAIIDAIVQIEKAGKFSTNTCNYIYDNTVKGCVLRKFCVMTYRCERHGDGSIADEDELEEFPKQILIDICLDFISIANSTLYLAEINASEFYVYKDGD